MPRQHRCNNSEIRTVVTPLGPGTQSVLRPSSTCGPSSGRYFRVAEGVVVSQAVRYGPWMPRLARLSCRVAVFALESKHPSGRASRSRFHGREAGWMFPSGDDGTVRRRRRKKLVDPVSGSTCSILGASSCPTDREVDHYISPSSEDECTREGTSSWMCLWSYAGDSVMRFAAVSILCRAWIPEGGRTGEERT